MTGNEEDRHEKPEIVSDSLQPGWNQQVSSAAIPLGDVTFVGQNVKNHTSKNDMIEDAQGLNSAEVIKLQEESAQLASDGRGSLEVGCFVNERLHDPSGDVTKDLHFEDIIHHPERTGGNSAIGNCSCQIYAESNQNIGSCSEILSNDPSRAFRESGIRHVEVEINESLTNPLISQQPNLAVSVEPIFEGLEMYTEDGTNCAITGQFELPVEVVSNLDNVEAPAGKAARIFDRSGRRKKKNTRRVKKKYMLRSSHGNKRALRSRAGQKPRMLASNNQIGNTNATEESKHTRRKKKRTRKVIADEYSRIRKKLSYMLNRIGYEQSLIEAYSSEGWKGLSLEKLKPEKELQRATSEIVRRKLKIRDLFQHLDSMLAEGRLPEALFDEEGMISSEDIFCAKCGSKDLTLDNDIILCDGACVRGFHQFCLEPPLLKDDIPPGDEGWLCPACDCKVDCIDMLNESQGTNLSITDSCEKVFPEAVKAGNQDSTPGLYSGDSEDEDFDPDRPCTHEKVQTDESYSDDENATDSDNSEPQPKENQHLVLPSDDSEDDDYDPDAPTPCKVKGGSSSSDFSSDSEDLEAVLVDDDLHGSNGAAKSLSPKGRRGPIRISRGRGKNQDINDELKSLLVSEPGENGFTPASARRSVERLDYKRLHDETYGGASSDSSDDGDWTDTPRKRKRSDKEEKQQKDKTDASITKTHGKRRSGDTSTSAAAKATGGKHQSNSGRLGEAAKKRLYDAFNLNHYPDRATKESLAVELGITCQKVDKWFGNARWCFNHPEGRKINVSGKDVKKDSTRSPQADTNSNWKRLPSGPQKVGNLEENVSLPGSSKNEDERGKKSLERSENPKNRKRINSWK